MTDKVIWINRGWQPVDIGFCPSQKAWAREKKRLPIDYDYPDAANQGGHTHYMVNPTTGISVIIVTVTIHAERDAFEVISTLIHEAVHVWQFLCRDIGEDAPGIEMEAYGIQHIAEGLINAYTSTQGKDKDWNAIHG